MFTQKNNISENTYKTVMGNSTDSLTGDSNTLPPDINPVPVITSIEIIDINKTAYLGLDNLELWGLANGQLDPQKAYFLKLNKISDGNDYYFTQALVYYEADKIIQSPYQPNKGFFIKIQGDDYSLASLSDSEDDPIEINFYNDSEEGDEPERADFLSVSSEPKNYDPAMLNEASILKHLGQFALCATNQDNNYLVMHAINGISLADYLKSCCRYKCHDNGIRQKIMYLLLIEVESMHGNGIIHGDLKPDNIMLEFKERGFKKDKFGRVNPKEMTIIGVKIIDFGGSAFDGAFISDFTDYYLPPFIKKESGQSGKLLAHKSLDQYSTLIILWHLMGFGFDENGLVANQRGRDYDPKKALFYLPNEDRIISSNKNTLFTSVSEHWPEARQLLREICARENLNIEDINQAYTTLRGITNTLVSESTIQPA